MHLSSSTHKYTCKTCKNKIHKDDLETIYHEHLKDLSVSQEFVDEYLNTAITNIQSKEQELQTLEPKKIKLQKKIDQLLKLHEKGQIPEDGFKEISGTSI